MVRCCSGDSEELSHRYYHQALCHFYLIFMCTDRTESHDSNMNNHWLQMLFDLQRLVFFPWVISIFISLLYHHLRLGSSNELNAGRHNWRSPYWGVPCCSVSDHISLYLALLTLSQVFMGSPRFLYLYITPTMQMILGFIRYLCVISWCCLKLHVDTTELHLGCRSLVSVFISNDSST